MNREEAIEMWVIPALKNTWNEKKCNEILEALDQEPCDELDFVQPHKKMSVNLNIEEPSQPKTGYISIDDVMSVFDDFMCEEVDEDGMNTFLEMLKDKAESEG